MALRAALGHFWWTPDIADNLESEEPTRFKLKRLTGNQATDIRELVTSEDKDKLREGVEKAIRWSLLDWENFQDDQGKPIPYQKEKVLDLLRLDVREKMGDEIYMRSSLSEEQEGNLNKPSGI